MNGKKKVLVIGIDPKLIDFSSPEYAAFQLDAAKVIAGLKSAEEGLRQQGYEVELCMIDFGETAEATVRRQLETKQYDCIVIGAGIRAVPSNFLLFEKLINVIHAGAPQARIGFNTKPSDTVEAVQRWVPAL